MITRNKSVKCIIGQRENVTMNVHGTVWLVPGFQLQLWSNMDKRSTLNNPLCNIYPLESLNTNHLNMKRLPAYLIPQTWIIYSIESLNWTAWVLVAIDSSWWIGDGINRKLITWVTRLRRSYSPNYYNSSRYQLKKSGLEPIRSKQLLTESWMVWKSTTDSITLRCITAKLLGEDPELGGARPLLILLTSDFCELTWPKGCCSTPSTLCHWNYIRKIASYSSQSQK